MTTFADNILSGDKVATSAASSFAPVILTRTFRFAGTGTQTFTFPKNVENLDAKLFIMANGSAATTDRITVSAAGTNYLAFTSFGSAGGIVRQTTTGLGTYTPIASACASVSTTAEVTAAVTLLSVDQAAVYQLQLMFNRSRTSID